MAITPCAARSDAAHESEALTEIAEARKLLDLATETLNRAVTADKRLVAIGEAISARRLLDQAKATIDRAAQVAGAD